MFSPIESFSFNLFPKSFNPPKGVSQTAIEWMEHKLRIWSSEKGCAKEQKPNEEEKPRQQKKGGGILRIKIKSKIWKSSLYNKSQQSSLLQ